MMFRVQAMLRESVRRCGYFGVWRSITIDF